jgi:hypothetical protein
MPGAQRVRSAERGISRLAKRRLTKPLYFGFLKRLSKETPSSYFIGVSPREFVEERRLCVNSWKT